MKTIQSLLLVLVSLLLTACIAMDAPIVMGSTNLDGVNIPTETDSYPIFINGNLAEGTFTYDGETEPTVSLTDLVTALCSSGFAEISGEGDVLTMRYAETVLSNEAVHAEDLTIITLTEDSDTVHIKKPDAEETVALAEPVVLVDGIVPDVELPWSDAAAVLGLNVSFYDAQNVEPWDTYVETLDSPPYYLYCVPHLMFWQYPEKIGIMPQEEAVRQVREVLITAYENRWVEYPPSDAAIDWVDPEAEQMYNIIENLTVTGQNDRFWRIPVVYDFLVDKYTGEIFTYYNGMEQMFAVFDPTSEWALTFAG